MAQPLIPTKQGRVDIGGREANIICSHFGNKILICITHVCKLGTLIHASRDDVPEGPSPSVRTYSIQVLLGKDDELHNVFARGIAQAILSEISDTPPPSLLIALSLWQLTPDILKEVLHHLDNYKLW